MKKKNPLNRLFLKIISLLICFFPACQTRPFEPRPPEKVIGLESIKIDSLSSRYIELVSKIHPSSLLCGTLEENGPLELNLDPTFIKNAEKEAEILLHEAISVPDSSLTKRKRIEKEYLLTRLKILLVELKKLNIFSRDPGVYLDELEASIAISLSSQTPVQKAERLITLFDSFPKVLNSSIKNLKYCPKPFILNAMQRANSLEKRLAKEFEFEKYIDKNLKNELFTAKKRAQKALNEFASALEKNRDKYTQGPISWGEEALKTILTLEGIFFTPSFLRIKLKEEMDQLKQNLVNKRHSNSVKTPYLGYKQSKPISLLNNIINASWKQLEKTKNKLKNSKFKIARIVPSKLFVNGWITYQNELINENYAFSDLEYKFKKIRFEDCIKAYVALSIHTDFMTLQKAAIVLEKNLNLTPKEAEILAIEIARKPLDYLGYLGMKLIREKRFEFRKTTPEIFTQEFFEDSLFEMGGLSFQIIDKELLKFFASQ